MNMFGSPLRLHLLQKYSDGKQAKGESWVDVLKVKNIIKDQLSTRKIKIERYNEYVTLCKLNISEF